MNNNLATLARHEPESDPIVITLEGSPVRSWMNEEGQPMWFASTEFGKAVGLGQSRMSQIVQELADEDRGIRVANTPGGRQKVTVISRSGAYQVIAQLQDKELGKRLRKRLADLGVAFETGKLKLPGVPLEEVAALTQEVSGLRRDMRDLFQIFSAALAPRATPRLRTYAPTPVSARAEADYYKRKWLPPTAFLTKETGQAHHAHGQASGLTTRCIHFCEDFLPGETLYARHTKRGKQVTFISEDILRLVYRNDWRRGQPNPMSNPLF